MLSIHKCDKHENTIYYTLKLHDLNEVWMNEWTEPLSIGNIQRYYLIDWQAYPQ